MTEDKRLQKEARLRRERTLIMTDLGNPGWQLIMRKLNQASQAMLLEYDKHNPVTDQQKIMRIQVFREVINEIIPAVLETAMNVDVPKSEPEQRWTFKGWLKDVWHCVDELIDNTWLSNLKQIFH